jgi:dTDP-4-amino-4,6-dideoxygalactose transaminase
VYHLFVIRSPQRDGLQKHLIENEIFCGLHYPVPLHMQKAYAGCSFNEATFPVSEKASAEILSVPMFPGIEVRQQDAVASQIKQYLAGPDGGQCC